MIKLGKKKVYIVPILTLVLYTLIFLLVFRFGTFVDEHEQITSAWFISQGMVPYKDFFSHHAPLPLYIGLPAIAFSGIIHPILFLRLEILLFHLLCWAILFHFTSRKFVLVNGLSVLLAAGSLATFSLHMGLASSLVTPSLMVLGLITFHSLIYSKPKLLTLILLFGIFSFICISSSIASIIPIILLALCVLVSRFRSEVLPASSKQLQKIVGAIALGIGLNLFFSAYYFLRGIFHEYWWSVFTYNAQYYFTFRLADSENERKYGAIYAMVTRFFEGLFESSSTFFVETWTLKSAVRGSFALVGQPFSQVLSYYFLIFQVYLDKVFSVESLMMFGIFLSCLSLLYLRKSLVLPYAVVSVAMYFRYNELFHLSPVFLWAGVGIVLSLHLALEKKNKFIIAMSVVFFGILFLSVVGQNLVFMKYQPGIFIATSSARTKSIIENSAADSKILLLDGQILDYWETKRLPAQKVYFYHPWIDAVPEFHDLTKDTIANSKAQIILIDTRFPEYAPELYEILQRNYISVDENKKVYLLKGRGQ